MEVNGQSFLIISHDEAVHILKTGRSLQMKVRDVGRLPHARTMGNDTKWIPNPNPNETDATANSSSVSNHNVNPSTHTTVSASTCTSR